MLCDSPQQKRFSFGNFLLFLKLRRSYLPGREQTSLSVQSRQKTNTKSSHLLEMLQGCIPACLSTPILCFEESQGVFPQNFYQLDPVSPCKCRALQLWETKRADKHLGKILRKDCYPSCAKHREINCAAPLNFLLPVWERIRCGQ